MQSEIIYIPNTKVILLEELINYFNGNFSGNIIKIRNIERIGKPFSFITNQTFKDTHSFHYQPEKIFKEFMNPNLQISSLNYYLNQADIQFTLARNESKEMQYLGLVHGNPTNFNYNIKIHNLPELESKKSIFPCQFYLIKDKI